MPALGSFTFVLHSHLPYVRLAGRWPHGEEWIHEAASETYIPLLQTLFDLKEEGIDFKLTLGITPILAEQLANSLVLDHFDQYLDQRIKAAQHDVAYFKSTQFENSVFETEQQTQVQSDSHLHQLAQWYEKWYKEIKEAFNNRFNRDIIGSFRQLQDEGFIEIITSAASHGYLPLLSHDSSIKGQLKTAIASYQRFFNKAPTSIWLPECAYRPAYLTQDGNIRAGIETFLEQNGINVFFSETHTITGGQPVGVAAGDVIGPYGNIKRRYVIPQSSQYIAPRPDVTTYKAYYVSNSMAGANSEEHSNVSVIGRNNRTGQQVWSADWGYPGDFDYREFHKRSGTSGLQYWRVTGAKTDLAHKDYYHPEWAKYKVEQHAEHFAHLVGDLLREHITETGEHGLIASNYDTELFGHWWFEGVNWLGSVLRHLAKDPNIELTTASQYITDHPPSQTLHIPESSWGAGGNHFTWNNGENYWMWEPIHECEATMEALANQYTNPTNDEELVLNQAARELLLLQSSDWPFLITTGQAREYAIQRFSQHLERFNKLTDGLKQNQIDIDMVNEYYELDKVFPDINYRWFT